MNRRATRDLLLGSLLALIAVGCQGRNYLDPSGPRYAQRVATPAPDEEPLLRVVSFNIAYGEDIDRAIEELAADPELRDADVILLQEMHARGAAAIGRALGLHHVYYPASVEKGRLFGNAILSRWRILEDHKVVLPHGDPLGGQRRIAVAAILDAPGGRIAVYSVHAETAFLSLRGRLEQLERVLSDVDARHGAMGIPVIIGGDFNTLERWAVPDVRDLFTWRGFDHASREVPSTADYCFGAPALDHLFVRDLEVVRAGASPTTEASDHRPLYAVLRWPG